MPKAHVSSVSGWKRNIVFEFCRPEYTCVLFEVSSRNHAHNSVLCYAKKDNVIPLLLFVCFVSFGLYSEFRAGKSQNLILLVLSILYIYVRVRACVCVCVCVSVCFINYFPFSVQLRSKGTEPQTCHY